MTAASADQYGLINDPLQGKYGVDAADILYNITCIGRNASTGYARPLVAGDQFIGFNTDQKVDNTAGAADAKDVVVDKVAYVKEAIVGLVNVRDEGKKVYATDDNTYTISPGVPGASTCVGVVHAFISAAVGIIKLDVAEQYRLDAGISSVAPAPAQLTTATALTLTAAQLLAGFIRHDPSGGAATDTLPTADLLLAAIPNAVVGSKFEFVLQNDADAAETITVAAGTGGTLAGTATIAQNNSKRFLVEFTSVTAASVAYNVFSLGTFVF